ncbi:unnamed protein product [Pedinophyceae sp. YPF-701]|nr:unnamed protein product [Pedinophyceae sp. YPF-701]
MRPPRAAARCLSCFQQAAMAAVENRALQAEGKARAALAGLAESPFRVRGSHDGPPHRSFESPQDTASLRGFGFSAGRAGGDTPGANLPTRAPAWRPVAGRRLWSSRAADDSDSADEGGDDGDEMHDVELSPALEASLKEKLQEYEDLQSKLSSSEAADMKQSELSRIARRVGELASLAEKYQTLLELREELEGLVAILSDAKEGPEMREMAEEDVVRVEASLKALERDVALGSLPPEPEEELDVLLEVRGAVGGEEACQFALELYRMYERYAAARGWDFRVVEWQASESGGVKMATAQIAGDGVYRRMRFEGGIHRVARVPKTIGGVDKIQTSAASVVVMPTPDDTIDIKLDPKDLKIETTTATGPGGQAVNKTESAVRITHAPSGITVQCQEERSQHTNKERALATLRARLYDLERRRKRDELSGTRRSMIGSGDRSERIRSYKYLQSRVTDHRLRYTSQDLAGILDGGEELGRIHDMLLRAALRERLAALAGSAP